MLFILEIKLFSGDGENMIINGEIKNYILKRQKIAYHLKTFLPSKQRKNTSFNKILIKLIPNCSKNHQRDL